MESCRLLILSVISAMIWFTITEGFYDTSNCILSVNRKNGLPLSYDLSRVSGKRILVDKYKYENTASEDEAMNEEHLDLPISSKIPVGSTLHVEIHLCTYLKPIGEAIQCGNRILKPPSTCITVTYPNNTSMFLPASKNLTPVLVGNGLMIKFNVSTGTGPFLIRFKLSNLSGVESDPSIQIASKSITVHWHLESFAPSTFASVSNSCIIKTDHQVFNLQPLISENGYSYNAPDGQKYLLNFCEGLRSSRYEHSECKEGSAICLVGHSTLAYMNSSQLAYSSYRGLSLRYNLGLKRSQVNFVCDSGRTSPIVKLVSKEPILIFNISSSLTCPKMVPTCEINDSIIIKNINHAKYSFDGLSSDLNMEVPPNSSGPKYIFNICKQLVPSIGLPYTGGNIFAVLVQNGSATNLGIEQLPPKLNENRDIIIAYSGSDKCDDYQSHQFSIRLVCNRNNRNSNESKLPKILQTTDKCKHEMVWETSSACSYSYAKFEDCKFNGFEKMPSFDFSSLRRTDDYKIKTSNGWIFINVCGFLNYDSQLKATAIYKTNSKEELVIGRNSEIEIRDGFIRSIYKGDTCFNSSSQSYAVIEFLCNEEMKETTPVLVSEIGDCHFHLKWPTRKACVEQSSSRHSENCYFTSLRGRQFEISDKKNAIYFTICADLQGSPAILCGSSSSVYWISELNSERDVCFDDKEINATACNNNLCVVYQNSRYSVKLEFECVPNENMTDKINLQLSIDKYHATIKLQTSHACSSFNTTTDVKTSQSSFCKTSFDKPRIDLDALSQKIWTFDNYKVNVSLCSPLPLSSSLCGAEVGLCEKVDGKFQGYLYSDEVLYKPWLPYLNYSMHASTALITFPCNHSGEAIRTFRRIDDITSIITWPTAASCTNQKDSILAVCNYSELDEHLKVYNISLSDKKYIMVGLCAELPPQCLSGTGSCLIDRTQFPETYLVLGYPKKSFKDNYDNWVFNFEAGAMCNRYGLQYSTVFKLVCVHDKKKQKIYHSYDESKCEYYVEFRSIEFCHFPTTSPPHQNDKSTVDAKKLDDEKLDILFDTLPQCSKSAPLRCLLDNLSGVKPINITDDKTKKKYVIEFSLKNHAAVSRHSIVSVRQVEPYHWIPIAQFHNLSYINSNSTFKISYKGDLNLVCGGETEVDLFMACRHDSTGQGLTINNENPSLRWDSKCSVGMEWYTDHACMFDDVTHHIASSASSIRSYNWTIYIITGVILLTSAVVMLLRKNLTKWLLRIMRCRRIQCCSEILPKSSSRISLASISSSTEITLLSNPQNSY